mmetsp:Transcript_20311/g.35740  ORF Transcript_20311/g.35740 Transcript_20311/m.35740 type:complete len:114 (+) Transcript_20311:1-342(+)
MKRRLMLDLKSFLTRQQIDTNPAYLKCMSPLLESRMRTASSLMMKLAHESVYGSPMTKREYAEGQAKQDMIFMKNKASFKYCDLDCAKVVGDQTLFGQIKNLAKPFEANEHRA